jgi:hypothetical protein
MAINVDRLRKDLRLAVDAERTAFGRASRWQRIYMKRFERRYALQQKLFAIEAEADRVATRLLGKDHNNG